MSASNDTSTLDLDSHDAQSSAYANDDPLHTQLVGQDDLDSWTEPDGDDFDDDTL
jgi:hypothetical protein